MDLTGIGAAVTASLTSAQDFIVDNAVTFGLVAGAYVVFRYARRLLGKIMSPSV